MRGTLAALGIVCGAAAGTAVADEPLIRNGDFTEWKDGAPVGWTVTVVARHGDTSESRIEPLDGGGVALVGDEQTRRWRSLTQPVTLARGVTYRLTFEARAIGAARQPHEWDTCYVGVRFHAPAEGRTFGGTGADVRDRDWQTFTRYVSLAPDASTADLSVCLAHPGCLEARKIVLRAVDATAAGCFSMLVDELGARYSYFAHRGIDWPALTARFRERAVAAADTAGFVDSIRPMLAELRDLHVWIDPPGGARIQPYADKPVPNFDIRAVVKRLTGPRQIGKLAVTGRTAEGFGYLAIGSLVGSEAEYAPVVAALDALLDAPGLILDLRGNGGGNERHAQTLISRLADEPRVYARARVRSGPAPTDLSPPVERRLVVRSDVAPYARPIVALIGPCCMSSGEGMAKMLEVLPNATLVGQPTRGASGNPKPLALPNGVTVWFSTWVDERADGTVLEGKGVPPDVAVAHEGPGDPTFEAGVRILAERVAAAGAGK